MSVFDRVELLPARSRPTWRLALTVLLLLAAGLTLADAARRYFEHERRVEQVRGVAFRQQLDEQRQAAQRAEQEQQLRRLDAMAAPWVPVVAFPWDELLTSVENVREPGLILMSLSVDAQRGTARIVVDCASASQAAELSSALNLGYPQGRRPWRLLRTRAMPSLQGRVEAELEYVAGIEPH